MGMLVAVVVAMGMLMGVVVGMGVGRAVGVGVLVGVLVVVGNVVFVHIFVIVLVAHGLSSFRFSVILYYTPCGPFCKTPAGGYQHEIIFNLTDGPSRGIAKAAHIG